MATLVLGAVGSAIGGPIGGALGAMLGNAVDRAVLGPARRQGPRLTELQVQTSSYGTQLPRLFGTMRVGGTVIWSTDLIETRGVSRGGKGRPATETYSYAASFAVALSARPIRRLRRIWADGRLLRGAGGDFKTATGFRLYLGGEDQPVDPAIAAAEGAAAPAHRGIAYAVFEDMALGDYGNRIPQLTFEVEADDGPVSVGAIARALAPEVTGAAALPLGGFAGSGGSVRAVLEVLTQAGGGWWAGLDLRDGAGAPVTVTDAGVRAGNRAAGGRRLAADDSVPVRAVVAHHDPARDYQLGVQHARRPGSGVREVRLDLPAAIPAGEAKTLATALLARAEGARMRRTVTLDADHMGIGPGDTVRIAGEDGVWRVTEAAVEAMVVRLELVPLVPAGVALSAASGRHVGAADRVAGATRLAVFETPALDDAVLAAPRLTAAAAGGAGWRSASLHYSLDQGASWVAAGMTAAPAVMGTIVALAPGGSAALVDDRAGLVVHVEGRLHDADDAALDGGANLALLGDELIQFARGVAAGGGRWRLEGLRRGLRGTEAAIGLQRPGDRFILLEAGAARTIDLPVAALGRRVDVMAHGVGDGIEGVTASVLIAGASVRPPMPVGARQHRLADGRVAIAWTRRSRAGWRWLDGVDVPLGEEREAYRVSVNGTEVDTAEPRLDVAAPPGTVVTIRQRGTLAESPPLMLTIT